MSLRKSLQVWLRKFEKDFKTHNQISISRSAITHNVSSFKKRSKLDIIPVLKSNAYGHGLQQVATILKPASFSYVAVDGYFEALRIREVSSQPVLIMGAIHAENFKRMSYDAFAFVVQDEATIDALGKTGKHIAVHLECNTGMNRYGAQPEELEKLTKQIINYPNLKLEGVMSHLADSDGKNPEAVDTAVSLFDRCVESVKAAGAEPTLFHIAQSAGSLKARSKYATHIRLGIGLYGVNPFPHTHPLYRTLSADLRPVLQFTSTITKIIELKKGDKVSYNYTFTAPRAMRIGVIPVGYYEGLDRALSNRGAVKIGNSYAPIVGRICMNHTMINLEDLDCTEGDTAVVYSHTAGDKSSIDEIAAQNGLFNYSMLTYLSADIRRVISD